MVTTVQRGHATTLIAVRIGHQCTHRGSPTDRDLYHRAPGRGTIVRDLYHRAPGRGIVVRDQSHRALARVIIVHHGHRYLAQDLGVTNRHQLRQVLEPAARTDRRQNRPQDLGATSRHQLRQMLAWFARIDRRQSRAQDLGVTSHPLFPVQDRAANLRHLLRRARKNRNLQKARILMADQSGTKTSLRVVDKFRQSATFFIATLFLWVITANRGLAGNK